MRHIGWGVRGIMVIGLAGLLLVAGAIASLIVVEAMNTEAIGRVTLERSQYMTLWGRYIEHVSGTSNGSKALQSQLQKTRTPDVRSIALVDESMNVLAGKSASPRLNDALVLDAFSQNRANRLTTGLMDKHSNALPSVYVSLMVESSYCL